MAEEEKKEGEGKKSSNLGAILKVAFIVINVLITGGGAFLVFKSTLGWTPPVITEVKERESSEIQKELQAEQPILYTMEKFTVNLNGSPKRIIRIEINLEMLSEQGFEEVIQMGAQARDSIVKILNGKNFSEIESIQGKLFLKDQIQKTINSLLINGVVKDVFFTEFVVSAST